MKKKKILISIAILLLIGCVVTICLYQFTNLFGNKIFPVKIDSITIKYYPGYDLKTGSTLNEGEKEFIKEQELSLSGEELQAIKKAVQKITIDEEKNKRDDLLETYEIVINKNITLKMGNQRGTLIKDKKTTPVIIPNSLYQDIENIVDKNNQKVLQVIETESVVAKLDGASIVIKNADNLKYIQDALTYYPVTIEEDFKSYEGGYKIELILDQNVHVYLYNDKVGYIKKNDGEMDVSTYGVFPNNVYDLINQIYEVSTK